MTDQPAIFKLRKIALLADGVYPHYIGGMQRHSAYLAQHLARRGIDVDLYTRAQAGRDELHVKTPPFGVETPGKINTINCAYPRAGRFPGHYLKESYQYSRSIYQSLIKRMNVDFIYCQGFTAWALLGERVRNKIETPPVGVNFHGLEMFQRSASLRNHLEQILFRPFVKTILRNADVCFSLGAGLTEILVSLGIPEARIFLSPNGLNTDWLCDNLPATVVRRRFVYVGRYERRKGVEELTAVAEKLSERFPSASFVFIGPIPFSLRSASPRIEYMGLVADSTSLRLMLSAADVLVCPSYAEGVSTSIFEGLGSGLAVIASDVGGTRSIVSKSNGWLIPPGDQAALEAAIVEAVTLPPDAMDLLKKSSLEIARRNTWDKVVDKTIEEMARAISSAPKKNLGHAA